MVNRENYLLCNKYLKYLSDSRRVKQASIDRYRANLRHLLLWADETPFSKAHKITPGFLQYLDDLRPALAKQSQKKIIETTRSFFRWGKQIHIPGVKDVPDLWIGDLTPPKNSRDNSRAEYVTLDEAIAVAKVVVKKGDLAMLRDRAAAAMLFCSGARSKAFTTLPILAVHLEAEHPYILQMPELGVRTKNDKSAKTYLLEIPELMTVIQDWDDLVRSSCPNTYPWYAPIHQEWGNQSFTTEAPGKNRSQALSKRLHFLFAAADLPYRSPHKFRHGFATYGLSRSRSIAEYHAVSRNLMHSSIAITDNIYAHQEESDRARLLAGIVTNRNTRPDGDNLANLQSAIEETVRNTIRQVLEKEKVN